MNKVRLYITHNGTDSRLVDICDECVRHYELSDRISYLTDSENGAMCQSCCKNSFMLDELNKRFDRLMNKLIDKSIDYLETL